MHLVAFLCFLIDDVIIHVHTQTTAKQQKNNLCIVSSPNRIKVPLYITSTSKKCSELKFSGTLDNELHLAVSEMEARL